MITLELAAENTNSLIENNGMQCGTLNRYIYVSFSFFSTSLRVSALVLILFTNY